MEFKWSMPQTRMDTVKTQQVQDCKMERKSLQGQKQPQTNITGSQQKGGRWIVLL